MSTAVGIQQSVVVDTVADRRWNRARYTLLVCWALVALAVPVLGSQPTSLGRLESALATGNVHAVRLEGGLPPKATGSATVQVYWRSGPLRHRTEVIEARPRREAPYGAVRKGVVTRDVGAHLRDLQPGLRVTRGPDHLPSYATLWGWYMPGWLGLVTICLALATVYQLVNGPQPWRATRWAWLWLMASPLGIGAFLLLSGPTPVMPAPRRPGRRLTGGWALLLSLVVTPMLVPG